MSEEKLDEIINLLKDIKNNSNNERKVKLEFDYDDKIVPVIVNVNKLVSALYDLSQYRREIYKYDVDGEIYVDKDNNKIYTLEEINSNYNRNEPKNLKSYVDADKVIEKIDNILYDVNEIIENYWF